jgi:hypothetical protein
MTTAVRRHRVFGVTCEFDFDCAGLPIAGGPPDVRVRRAPVPEHLAAATARGAFFESARNQFLFNIDAVARYLVEGGDTIRIEPHAGAAMPDLQTFLFGPVFTALLHQRGALVLHAGAVVGRGGAVLVAGRSGSGKSTLLAALARRGFRLLTDDVAVVRHDADDRLVVHPGPRYLKLWEDAMERMGGVEDAIPVRRNVRKFAVPIDSAFADLPEPVKAIYVIDLYSGDAVIREPVEDSARFALLCAHTRAFRVLGSLGVLGAHFQLGAALAGRTPMALLKRPRGRETLDELCAHIERALA